VAMLAAGLLGIGAFVRRRASTMGNGTTAAR
jgi:hypothetical protein